MNATIIMAVLRWVATILGSSAVGIWLSTYLTPEVVNALYSNISSIIGSLVALFAIIASIREKMKISTVDKAKNVEIETLKVEAKKVK